MGKVFKDKAKWSNSEGAQGMDETGHCDLNPQMQNAP